MSELRFDGRVAVVTGAGAGLGREYALLFASRGAKVVVNDLGGTFHGEGKSTQAADVVVNEIIAKGGIAVPDYNSVTDGEKIIQTALNAFGRVDILVNNAGILRDKSFPRTSEQDWDLVNDVHVKGSFKTTQAAWPVFRKQNYGRIIMTSSNSGIYGNYGQANYAAAKLALVGLAKTLFVEGEKYNIHCNVIVPTAASRMTQDVMPEILFNELKPKLIAPVVAYLCHESIEDNGSVIESAAGWATKVHFVRGAGSVLRSSLSQDVTPEYVRDVWSKITDMSAATHCNNMGEALGVLVDVLEKAGEDQVSKNGEQELDFVFSEKDLILYALGVGASLKNADDLRYLYENHEQFSALPSYFIMPGLILQTQSSMITDAITHTDIDLSKCLHGEQYFEVRGHLPTDGVLKTVGKVVDITDKKSGALAVTECNTYDKDGNHLFFNQSATFILKAGNFGGKRNVSKDVIPTIDPPKRAPDATVKYSTHVDQAAVYRLSGDTNPLHIDPNFAKMGGQPIPILHGLCVLGFSLRAVMETFANNDSEQFKAIKVRFTKPVIPGQTLKIEMWSSGQRVFFRTSVLESGIAVIEGAYVDLKMVATIRPNLTAAAALQSDAVFQQIKERIAADPAKAKSINAVFAYKITKNGKITKEWTLDLKNASVYDSISKDVKIDTTLTVADGDMVDIALGKLNPQAAFMKGKLKITGNIMLTQKLVPLLKTEAKL